MCVIAISEAGVITPTEQNLKDMFEYNSDGAGISFVLDGLVHTFKGLMKWEDFQKTYALIEKKVLTAGKTFQDIPIMYHFRIGTHGPNSEALTHPFPISNNFKHLSAIDFTSEIVMAHNGIIHTVTPSPGWSDTQQYIADIVYPLTKYDRVFYKSKHLQKLLENTIDGSRLAFLDITNGFTLIGDWKESDNKDLKGIKYSNLNHEYTTPSYWSSSYGYYPSNFYKTDNTKYKSIYAAPVPVGTRLFRVDQLDKDFLPLEGTKALTVSVKDMYYVDDNGDLYRESFDGVLYPTYTLDFAIDDNGEVLDAYHPSIAKDGNLFAAGAVGASKWQV